MKSPHFFLPKKTLCAIIFCRDFLKDPPTNAREIPISGVTFIVKMHYPLPYLGTVSLSRNFFEDFPNHSNFAMIPNTKQPKLLGKPLSALCAFVVTEFFGFLGV